MSCFVCFGSAAQDGEARKPPAAGAGKDAPPDRAVARVGSDKSRSQGGQDSKKDLIIHRDGNSQNIAAQTFTFRELAAATKNFRQDCLLGEGGFGRVYKGRLENGQAVAVKQLDRNGLQGNREFLVEVLMLSLLHHTNLVSLIGYCADGDQRLLVYEFMPLGSLEDHLHGWYAPFLAALAPGINIIRMLLLGLGLMKNEAMVKSVSRFADYRELLKGPLYYATTITFATSVLWRTSPVAIALICNLCAGDESD